MFGKMFEDVKELRQWEERMVAGRIEGAVFDMDGTLLDSMHVWDTIGETYLMQRGIAPGPGIREVLRPMSLRQAAEYLVTAYGIKDSVEQIMDNINASIENFYCCEAQGKPGAGEALNRLHLAGVKMCVATATDRHLAEAALKRNGLDGYFGGIFTCNEVGAGKDRPDIYRQAAESLGTPPERTYIFEDALFAAQTVKAAGMLLAVVEDTSAAGQKRELKAIADLYIEDWRCWLG